MGKSSGSKGQNSLILLMVIGLVLFFLGVSMMVRSAYSIPPIPAGFFGGVLFLILGGAAIQVTIIMVFRVKKNRSFWLMAGIGGGALVFMGMRFISENPLELPPCACAPLYWGPECLPCPDCGLRGECNDGALGDGICYCDQGWGGAACDVCAPTFKGVTCEDCKRGWDGLGCDVCYPGYSGPNCDVCDVGWIPESDSQGTLCRYCEPGRFGGYCEECPVCNTHDSLAICRDNVWHDANVFTGNTCTQTAKICRDKYDCPSFNCQGVCTDGSITDGTSCVEDEDCTFGTCQYRTCCAEARHGDGWCQCGRNGYGGPTCEPCPGFDGVYSSSICGGHGTCAAAFTGSGADETYVGLRCECVPDGVTPFPAWTGDTCGCLKNKASDTTCSKCANGFFGEQCTMCPGGGGISQCNRNGLCSDGIDGDGTCDCNVDIKFGGLGGWGGDSCSSCHSGDFYGDKCETCPGILMVGCHTSSFLATLPGSGNCITSCGPKTCNSVNGICE